MRSILIIIGVTFLGIFLFMTCLMSMVNCAGESTNVSIEPVDSVVDISESSYTIGVYCNPIMPIRAFECNIRFDSSLLSVTDVHVKLYTNITRPTIIHLITKKFKNGRINYEM